MKAQRATPTPVLRAASAAALALSAACCFGLLSLVEDIANALLCVRLAQSRSARNELSEIGLIRGGKIAVVQSARHDPARLRCRGGLIALRRVVAAPKHVGKIAPSDRPWPTPLGRLLARWPSRQLPSLRPRGVRLRSRPNLRPKPAAPRRSPRRPPKPGAHAPYRERKPHRYARAPNRSRSRPAI